MEQGEKETKTYTPKLKINLLIMDGMLPFSQKRSKQIALSNLNLVLLKSKSEHKPYLVIQLDSQEGEAPAEPKILRRLERNLALQKKFIYTSE